MVKTAIVIMCMLTTLSPAFIPTPTPKGQPSTVPQR